MDEDDEPQDFDEDRMIHPHCPVRGHSSSVSSVRFSEDGALVLSSGDDNTVPLPSAATCSVRENNGRLFEGFVGEAASSRPLF